MVFRDMIAQGVQRSLAVSVLMVQVTVGGCRQESPCLRQVSDNGFGHPWNRYAWAMATFGEHLYVGTMNMALWGEHAGQEGPANSISQGTEIWRFDGLSWEQVVDNGFKGSTYNVGTRSLVVHNGMLYAGTANYREGCEVWHTADGITWEPIMQGGFGLQTTGSVRGMATYNGLLHVGVEILRGGAQIHSWDGSTWTKVVDGGIDNRLNMSVADMVPWRGLLYILTWNVLGFEIYTYDGSTFDRISGFGAPNPPGLGQPTNIAVLGVSVYNDRLYLGTADFVFGADLFRTDDGINWAQLVENGFNDHRQIYIWRMKEYRGDLYMGTMHQGDSFPPYGEGGRIYRLDPEESFEELVGPNGLLMEEGFGDWMNYGIRTMSIFNDKLYLGTAQCYFCPCRKGTEIWELDPDAPGCDLQTSG